MRLRGFAQATFRAPHIGVSNCRSTVAGIADAWLVVLRLPVALFQSLSVDFAKIRQYADHRSGSGGHQLPSVEDSRAIERTLLEEET